MEPAFTSQQSLFYIYGPEPTSKSDNRLAAGVNQLAVQQFAMYQSMAPSMPSTPVFTRPNSSSSQAPVSMAPTLYSNGPAIMTPMASPRLAARKPIMMLDTDFSDCASSYLPSTPPLSSCGGSIGSPIEMMQTPMNPMFSGLDGLRHDFDVDNLSLDWSVCASPPMTPVYLQSQPVHKFATISRSSTDLSATSCPSLSQSPSPSPYTRAASLEPGTSFCDPRNLTVTSAALSTTCDQAFPTSCSGTVPSSEGVAPVSIRAPSSQPSRPINLSEIDDDDITSTVKIEASADVRRPRAETGSSVVSLGHASFIGEQDVTLDDNSPAGFPSPPRSCVADGCHEHPVKRARFSSCPTSPARMIANMNSQDSLEQLPEDDPQVDDVPVMTDRSSASSGSDQPLPLPAPANRRGRKQSLTEDPSKTFICDVCHRRFRRQEHLKRHYRSLHTSDKPFECGECGKKFSRSDNLAQHARTHGSGAIVMDLLEDGTIHSFDPNMLTANFAQLGQAMYSLATQAAGSSESDSGSEHGGKKKRKRSD